MLARNRFAPVDPETAARVRAEAIADACVRHNIRCLVSFGETTPASGDAFESFCEQKPSGSFTSKAFRRYRRRPDVLVEQFDVTPPPEEEESFTLPSARTWLNQNAPDRPDTVEPVLGGALFNDRPAW